MSHFAVIVIVPESECPDRESLEEYIDERLALYSENRAVVPHEVPCYCGRAYADKVALAAEEAEFGDIETMREHYWAMYSLEEQNPERWKKFIQFEARQAFFNQYKAEHPANEMPRIDCEYCRGTGEYFTTSNPDSKWDWYQIGGRYNGALEDYQPEEDEENFVTCDLCAGTGQRTDEIGQQARERDPNYTCNGCSGKGKHLRWPDEWKVSPEVNIAPLVTLFKKEFIPYAVVTPDYFWHEAKETAEENWKQEVLEIYAEYVIKSSERYLGVLVDCHI